ncbi:MAG: hypothetical protein ACOVOR_00080 [Rhabdochlamydiaceae bacterium]
MIKLTFVAGFLGQKDDWLDVVDCLSKKMSIRFSLISLKQPLEEILLALQESDVCIGYSMGGRLILKLLKEKKMLSSLCILLSAHLGLTDKKEIDEQRDKENQWLAKLNGLPFVDFIEAWYSQDIFSSLKKDLGLRNKIKQKKATENPDIWQKVFENHRLSEQSLFIPSSCHFICGEDDIKYKKLYLKYVDKQSLSIVKNGGHILHMEQPEACSEIILNLIKHHSKRGLCLQ